MYVIILFALVFVVLYAAYVVWGPFSYRHTLWDTLTNVAFLLIWITLSALMTNELLAAQPMGFAKIMYFIGIMFAIMLVIVGAGFIMWVFFQWINISVIPAIERFFEKRKI